MSEDISGMIPVEVAYALPQQQIIIPLMVKNGMNALEAIQLSGLLLQFPEISLKDCKIGIFGKIISEHTPLQALDRVEIYRPLIANAKEARRLRASERNRANNKSSVTAQSGQKKTKK